MKLVIAIPCYDTVTRETALSLSMMMFRLGVDPPDGLEDVGIKWRSSSNLPDSRHSLAKGAIERGATHILWVDSDMGFPKDAAHRLIAHDLDIVGCNYPKRLPPHISAAAGIDEKPFPPHMKGLSEASVIGFGLLLMKTSVFDREFEMPLFANHDERGYCSDDVPFCRKVRAAGLKIWCDHDLSREVRHVGSVALGPEHIEAASK